MQKRNQNANENQKRGNFLKFESCETTEKYKKFIGNSNGMFVVESQDMNQGGRVEWGQFYRLRHLTTNKYLVLGQDTSNQATSEVVYHEKTRLVELTNKIKQATLFTFEMLYSTLSSRNRELLTKFLQKDSYFRLKAHPQLQPNAEIYWMKTADINDTHIQDDIESFGEMDIRTTRPCSPASAPPHRTHSQLYVHPFHPFHPCCFARLARWACCLRPELRSLMLTRNAPPIHHRRR